MIIDTFIFFNELDLLEIRLEELVGVVDLFVLVEANETFSGKPKELTFDLNKDRFRDFPIDHIVVPAFPAGLSNAWAREAYSRQVIGYRLNQLGVQGDDVIMLSDLDEIPRRECVITRAPLLLSEPAGVVYALHQDTSYYYVNCRTDDEQMLGTRMARAVDISDMQVLRHTAGTPVPNGGWHFSYLGGVEAIRKKIGAFSHTELNVPGNVDPVHLEACFRDGTDLFGRDMRYRMVPIDDSFPRHIVGYPSRFAHLIGSSVDAGIAADGLSNPAVSGVRCDVDLLYRLASTVSHVTLVGAGVSGSAAAFLRARPTGVVVHDARQDPAIRELEESAPGEGVAFVYHVGNPFAAEIEETDLLFLGGWRVVEQVRNGLARHHRRVRRYMVVGAAMRSGGPDESFGHRGIWPAVGDFLRSHNEWRLRAPFEGEGGLIVLVHTAMMGDGG